MKAFDNVEHNALLNTLKAKRVDDYYINPVAEANKGCTADITVFVNLVRKDVRKGDTISAKLFNTSLWNLKLKGGIDRWGMPDALEVCG